MTQIEVAKIIIKDDGRCQGVNCDYCPRINEKGGCGTIPPDVDDKENKTWFIKWLKENEATK